MDEKLKKELLKLLYKSLIIAGVFIFTSHLFFLMTFQSLKKIVYDIDLNNVISSEAILKEINRAANSPMDLEIKNSLIRDFGKIKNDIQPILDTIYKSNEPK